MTQNQSASGIRFGVALLRVSTDKQFQEGESIEAQRRKVEFAARRERIDIVSFFTEHYSGRKSDRKVLEELFQFLEKNPDVDYVIVGDIDRFTRGGTEIYLRLKRRLRELNVSLVDTTGIIQPDRNRLEHLGVEYQWSIEAPSRYAEIFMAEKARSEASDILTRLIGRQIQLTRDGYQVRPANFGYRNVKVTLEDGTRKTIMEPAADEKIFVRRIFELRAEGGVSDQQISDHVNALGYKSRGRRIFDPTSRKVIGHTGHTPMTPQQVQRIVKKPIYCGIRLDAWNQGVPVEAQIEPLVSIHLFNRANRGAVKVTKHADGTISVDKKPTEYSSHRHNPDFLLRHVVACNHCKKPMMASKSRGKSGKYFGYYHCSRGHAYLGMNKSEFETAIGNLLKSLRSKPSFLGLFREVVREVWVEKNRCALDEAKQIDTHIEALRTRQRSLIDSISTSRSKIVIAKLEDDVEEIEKAVRLAQDKRQKSDLSEAEIEAYFAIAKKLMEHPSKYVFASPTKEKLEKIWSFIFASRPTLEQVVNRTPDLTLIYRLSEGSNMTEKLMVKHLKSHWNLFVEQVQLHVY